MSVGLALVALRDNPRRRHLLVSRVLGKHIPARPATIIGAGAELAALVRPVLSARSIAAESAVVIGFAETATGLACIVADELDARSVGHSTRYPAEGAAIDVLFTEPHSHAVDHALLAGVVPQDAVEVFVVIDDELTSGTTVINLAQRLSERHPDALFVVASLIDARGDDGRAAFQRRAIESGLNCIEVSLERAEPVEIGAEIVRAEKDFAENRAPAGSSKGVDRGAIRAITIEVPRSSADRGLNPRERQALRGGARAVAEAIMAELTAGAETVLVLGTEEFMYLPVLVADRIAAVLGSDRVWSSTTTRSPGLVLDRDSYGLANGFTYRIDVPGEASAARFVYNVDSAPGTGRPFDVIALVCDDTITSISARAEGGLVDSLAARTPLVVAVQVGPGSR